MNKSKSRINIKKIYFLLFFVIITSCSQNEVNDDQLVKRQNITYEINSNNPFGGCSIKLDSNYQKYAKTCFKKGIPQYGEKYHPNGQINLIFRVLSKDGTITGLDYSECYHINGQVCWNEKTNEYFTETGSVISREYFADYYTFMTDWDYLFN